MKNSDYGIYGLLAGVTKASIDLNVPPTQIKQSIAELLSKKSKFFMKIKQKNEKKKSQKNCLKKTMFQLIHQGKKTNFLWTLIILYLNGTKLTPLQKKP